MAKCLLLLCIPLLLYSCTPEKVRIRSEKRISVTGKVVNKASRGLPEITVKSSGALGGNISDSPYQILGLGKTTGSGNFSFVSLDTYNSDFSVSVNSHNSEIYNDNYATLHYVDQEDDHSTFLTLGNIVLPEKIDFNFSILNTSGTQDEIRFSITYLQQVLYYQIIDGNIITEVLESYNFASYRTLQGIHNLNSQPFSEDIPTLEGSEINFTFYVEEEPFQEIIIPVTPENTSYVFEY